jgi:hypothetical protein
MVRQLAARGEVAVMSFSSRAVDRYGYRLGMPARLIAIGLATALCRRFQVGSAHLWKACPTGTAPNAGAEHKSHAFRSGY